MSGGGRQLAECIDCGKRIVLDPGVEIPGGRNSDREQHFALPSAAEEATALVKLFETGQCDVAEIRALISVSESERRCLEVLSDNGMLASTNVRKMLEFREKVLELFNGLAAQKDCAVPVLPRIAGLGATPADCETQTGEEEQSASPVFFLKDR
jgi:hypothetical protein